MSIAYIERGEGHRGLPTLTRWFLKTAMLYFLCGFVLGGVLLMTLGWKHQAIFGVLQPVYWHLLVVGWLMQCIFGVAYWMFPPFSKDQPQRSETLGWFTYGALNLGLLLRAVVEPWHSLSPQCRCRLAPGTVSGAPGSSRLGLRYQYLGPHPGPSALTYAHTESLFSARWSLMSGPWHDTWWPYPVAERYRLVPSILGVAPSSYLFGTDRWAEPMHSGSVLLDLPAL